jgi:ABC-2 type transport system permease protein
MTIRKTWQIFARDVTMGPRTMMVVWLILFPLIITFVIRLVFGNLVDTSPRLGVVDFGDSSIPTTIESAGGVDISLIDDVEELQRLVEADALDAGLVLDAGFDSAIRAGEAPVLQLFIGGESLASDRVVITVTLIDVIRGIAGNPTPVEVITEVVGDQTDVPFEQRLVPMLVLLAVAMAGIFLPASSLIQEKTTQTLVAVLATPAEVGDVFVAKGVVGFLLAFGAGVITVLFNGGFSDYTAGVLLVLFVGALMSVQLGLILGAAIKDIQTMFTVWKGGGIVLFAPAVLFLFPSVPTWIARIFPTYYFLGPLQDITINGASLTEVLPDLAIGLAVSIGLAVLAGLFAKRMEERLAAA